MPFWDEGTQCLYLAGKGDGNIRYFEYENDKFEYLSEYKSADPQRGVAFLPKRGVNMHENEVMRAFKTVNDSYIEPVSFIVPRRSETFQEDVYPPTVGLKPAVSSKEWFEGKDGLPPKVSMERLYEGQGMKEVEEGATPTPKLTESVKAPEPVQMKAEPKPEQTVQAPMTLRDPPPSVKEQGGSMMAMADKFTDRDAGNEESSDASSFEEVQRPAERTSAVKPTSPSATKDEAVTPAGNLRQTPQETERGRGPGMLDKVGWSPHMIIVTLMNLALARGGGPFVCETCAVDIWTGHANNAFNWTPERQQRMAGTGNQELEGGRGAAEQTNIQHGAHDGCDEIRDHVFEGKTLGITLLFGDDGMWWTEVEGVIQVFGMHLDRRQS
jgi:hypothetical protein